jgi:hypothetical protein
LIKSEPKYILAKNAMIQKLNIQCIFPEEKTTRDIPIPNIWNPGKRKV